MRLLLDTHIFLWSVVRSPRFTPAVRKIIEDAEAVHVSVASIWEIAIKVRLGKLHADAEALAAAIAPSGFIELPVKAAHAAAVMKLAAHHNDPFDRILIAQALVEPLRLATADEMLAKYSDVVMLV